MIKRNARGERTDNVRCNRIRLIMNSGQPTRIFGNDVLNLKIKATLWRKIIDCEVLRNNCLLVVCCCGVQQKAAKLILLNANEKLKV